MKKRLLAFTLAATMLLGSAMTVSAADDVTEITQASTSKTATVNVSTTITETYTVKVPKTITLDASGNYTKTGAIAVTGNLAGNKQVTVTVPATVALKATGKTDVSGSITSTKDTFTFEELANGAEKTSDLTIQATGLTAGDWKGTFVVTVALGSTT